VKKVCARTGRGRTMQARTASFVRVMRDANIKAG